MQRAVHNGCVRILNKDIEARHQDQITSLSLQLDITCHAMDMLVRRHKRLLKRRQLS